MRKHSLFLAIVMLGALRPMAAPPTPVVVELFTSEGCESCPPADVLLQQLATQPMTGVQIIPLSLHVDYWDQLGWKDRFSSPMLTNRQRIYGARFNADDIYTPQMVVDGRSQMVGSDGAAARKAIARASSARHGGVWFDFQFVEVIGRGPSQSPLRVTVHAFDLPTPAERADFMLAVTEDRLESKVTRGENRGRTLRHTAVVRQLVRMGDLTGSSGVASADVLINPDWKYENIHYVAFVQERLGGAILASGSNR